jgi:hypothetical protein
MPLRILWISAVWPRLLPCVQSAAAARPAHFLYARMLWLFYAWLHVRAAMAALCAQVMSHETRGAGNGVGGMIHSGSQRQLPIAKLSADVKQDLETSQRYLKGTTPRPEVRTRPAFGRFRGETSCSPPPFELQPQKN